MRKKLIAANWKMNKSYAELDSYVSTLREHGFFKQDRCDVVIAAPFVFLDRLRELFKGSTVRLAAQNVYWESKGAYTGEVSLSMLKDVGVDYVIIGHSERRQYFGDTDETVSKKVNACTANNLTAIFCVGESFEERNAHKTFSVIEKQVHAVLSSMTSCKGLVIAYEPIWAIGTGLSATLGQAQEVHHFIRTLLAKKFGASESEKVQILYGGSMNASNSKDLLHQADIDGGLVGGASLDAQSFLGILNSID